MKLYYVLISLPGLLWCVFLAFVGSGSHAARAAKFHVIEGMVGFIVGAAVGLVFTKLFMMGLNAYYGWTLAWGDMWPFAYILSYLGNDILGGADVVGTEIRTKPIPFILDFLTNSLTKMAAALSALKTKNDTTAS